MGSKGKCFPDGMVTQNQSTSIEQPDIFIALKRESLDYLPWAIAKVNRQGVITYGNRRIREIAGVDSIEDKNISDLFRDKELDLVREHLESRFTHRSADEYRVELTRPIDGVRVPILCSAMPETDEHGEVIGVIAVVRDLLTEDVSRSVHKAIKDLRDSRQILETLAKECERIVPFDIFGVTLYSADGDHARSLFLYPEGEFRPTVRWNEMTSYAKKTVESKKVVNVPDLEEWLHQPEWSRFRDDPDMQQALAIGLRSSVSYPVIVGNRVVATLGFGRKKDKGPFSKQDEERLGSLPLDAAVSMALHYQKVGELEFALGLIRKIALASESTEGVANALIEEIAQQYEWKNVSIFQPDEQEGCLRLVKQQAEKEFRLAADWHHPIDKGVTGHVYRTREPLNVPDVRDPKYKDMYIPGSTCSGIRSVLCIPIIVSGRVYWILDVEDSSKNSFANEEQQALQNILREVALVLELTSQSKIFSELLKRSKDAVIQTDFRNNIKETNPATKELLGYSEAEMRGTPLGRYFKDKNQGRRVEEANYVPNDEVHMLHKDGSEVSLLLSGTSLPKEIGLKVYVCTDLATRKRMENIAILRHMYNEIASQIKTPLSLAFTWLDRLQKIETQPPAADILAKTVKQLSKVDLSYERLLFYNRPKTIDPVEKVVFEIPFLLEKIKQDMPDSEADHVEVTTQPDVPPVRADLFQLWFCFESVLAYLLRFVPASDKVSVNIFAQSGGVAVVINGHAPRVTGGPLTDYAKTRSAIRAITEMALGEEMIRSFIEKNHAGRFRKRRGDGDFMEYVIELPGT